MLRRIAQDVKLVNLVPEIGNVRAHCVMENRRLRRPLATQARDASLSQNGPLTSLIFSKVIWKIRQQYGPSNCLSNEVLGTLFFRIFQC